jgi:hypothetical protein
MLPTSVLLPLTWTRSSLVKRLSLSRNSSGRVDFQNKSVEAYGSSCGLLGDFKNRETLVRDGSTVLNKFAEYGSEWQVIPSDPRLFHIVLERPQFPASQVRLKLLAQVSLVQPLARTVPMTSWSLKIWAWLVPIKPVSAYPNVLQRQNELFL